MPESVPEGEDPIHWRLLTTHPVESLEMAMLLVEWYALRWLIEELFRILKQCLKVEESQFETGIALKKLLLLSAEASWKTLLMKQERQGLHKTEASHCFSIEEIAFLKTLQPGLEGNTARQKNPHPPETLAWAAWLVAILGGWKPAPLEKRPFGVVSLARGMKVFYERHQGWLMAMSLQNPDRKPT